MLFDLEDKNLNPEGADVVTVGMLKKVLEDMDDDVPVSLSIGPDYDDFPLSAGCYVPAHGGLFLIATDDEAEEAATDEEEQAIVGDFVELVEASAVEEEEVIPDGCEAA